MTVLKVLEYEIEARLAARFADTDNVLSVRRQVKCGGGKRADIVVLSGLDDRRCITVYEVKAVRAQIRVLDQLAGYVGFLQGIVGDGTPVHGVVIAPSFSSELIEAVEAYGCIQCMRLESVA